MTRSSPYNRKNPQNDLQAVFGSVFREDTRIAAAYLFGSRADGSFDSQSDYDVGVLLDERLSASMSLDDQIELELKLEERVKPSEAEVLILNRAPLVMQYRVISGLLLYARDDDQRAGFEERVVREYLDFEPALRQFRKEYFEALRTEHAE